ncbi:MAG: molecular chaperone Hsp33 [Kiritimatiellia bacterium]|jgi:molecular chaperone Hsp33
MNTTSDLLHRFIFDNTDIRGELVSLAHSLDDIFSIQPYPEAIKVLLGEFLTAVSLLSRTLKFDGTLTLQARGDGDLSLIMAELSHQKTIRGVAQINNADALQSSFNRRSLRSLLGNGMLSIIIAPKKGARYQGIVALDGEGLAQCLEGYFIQSEQLPTRIWLSCDGKKAGGMMLQRLPQQMADASSNTDAWDTQVHLANTLSTEELLNISHETLLTRLFHETNIRLFAPETISFGCHCSKERSSSALRRLEKAELDKIIEEEGEISVDCHFCGFQYRYLKQDIEQLFPDETHH